MSTDAKRKATLSRALVALEPFFGALHTLTFDPTGSGTRAFSCLCFDWKRARGKADFLDEVFSDGFPDGFLAEGDAGMRWAHRTLIPCAVFGIQPLEGVTLDDVGQIDGILYVDLGHPGCAITITHVDGSALPELPKPAFASLEQLVRALR